MGMDLDSALLGKRIQECRKQAGFTIEAAAQAVDAEPAWLKQVEAGAASIRLVVLLDLARLFEVDAADLIRGRGMHLDRVARFRAEQHEISREQGVEIVSVFRMLDAVSDLDEILGNGAVSPLADLARSAPRTWTGARQEGAQAAQALRKEEGLAGHPLESAKAFAAKMGVDAFEADLPDGVSGMSRGLGTHHPMIVVRRRDRGERKRFSLMHELAHHGFDADSDPIVSSWFSRRLDEARADSFAGEILLPKSAVIEHAASVGKQPGELHFADIADLSVAFGVSYDCAAYRLLLGGWIEQESYEDLVRETHRARGRRRAQGMKQGLLWEDERPVGLRTIGLVRAKAALSNGLVTVRRFDEYCDQFGFAGSTVAEQLREAGAGG